ncbi:MAG: methionyl-tRNA formyltransferase [Hyphomonadaceae bacterium]|nr:MAG: methionyl-tRNA formyltransferase [Caulobacteraceae bacterium]MBT9445354.1 methionyl-tRNA formyltransferase [Hyphomonadaceae bacterium]TPW05276.1 MAG: methionyl-tRNA formyltransferase [Alphaproteobacteria bacterium]
MSTFRIAFMGSPDFAVPALAELLARGREVVCVYSQPPRPAGRGQALRKTPVHVFSEERGIEVRTPKSLKKAPEQDAFAALDLDLAVVVAYGLILPKAVLDAPRLGCVNLHGSLLPRWRGAAPIQRALMAGDRETGVQVMRMEEGLDTGPVFSTARTPIEPDDTAQTLHDRLAVLGAPLLADAVDEMEAGRAREIPQAEDGVTYAKKIDPAEARIDWTKTAREIDLQIRGLSPFPGAWFELPGEKGPVRMKALLSRPGLGSGEPGEVLDDELLVACGEDAVRLLRVQREGRQALDTSEFQRGKPILAGVQFR